MSVTYSIYENEDMKGATIIVDGEPFTISSTHVSWDEIIGGLITGHLDSEEILDLINPTAGITSAFQRISERVAISPSGVVTFDGDPQDSALTDHILRIVTAKDAGNRVEEYTALANLLENLSNNPSEESKEHFYHFVRTHKMTITPDGYLIAYKGVNYDGTSLHSGYGIVDGFEYTNAYLPNAVGSVVEIPRSMVDGNRESACSVGLHVGSYEYARSFANRLLTVKVNPRDVVAVPIDHSNAKVRVTRYEVIEDNSDRTEYLTTLFRTDESEEAAHDELEDLLNQEEPEYLDDPEEFEEFEEFEELTIQDQVAFFEAQLLKDTLKVKKLIQKIHTAKNRTDEAKYVLKIAKANQRIAEYQTLLGELAPLNYEEQAGALVASVSADTVPAASDSLSVEAKYSIVLQGFGGVNVGAYGILKDATGDFLVIASILPHSDLTDIPLTAELREHIEAYGPYTDSYVLVVTDEMDSGQDKRIQSNAQDVLNTLIQPEPSDEADTEPSADALRAEMLAAREALLEGVSDAERARREAVYRKAYDTLVDYYVAEEKRVNTKLTTEEYLDRSEALEPLTGVVAPPTPENGLDPVRIQKTIDEINRLAPTVNLTRYRNKNISSGRRPYFDAAMKALGLS